MKRPERLEGLSGRKYSIKEVPSSWKHQIKRQMSSNFGFLYVNYDHGLIPIHCAART